MIPRVRRHTHNKNQREPLSWKQRIRKAMLTILKG